MRKVLEFERSKEVNSNSNINSISCSINNEINVKSTNDSVSTDSSVM